eukprot:TRINITY_DN32050_c0_g1_i2.p1 TRINITY_DN32050_c0_g1~~TRINITY_DN32050_c0_g1_i2.p1  ORF type:complete len:888 (+),score=288.00 TRINITY_DN32050_c0_g1_i2:110-2773(+)
MSGAARPPSPRGSGYAKSFQSAGLYSCLEEDELDASLSENRPGAEADAEEAEVERMAVANAGRWAQVISSRQDAFMQGSDVQHWGTDQNATVVFSDVTVPNPLGGNPILQDVSGILLPGKLTALLGSSDMEINALITLLAGVLDTDEYTGTVYYNKIPIAPWYRRTVVGFARTNGVFCSRSLTVRQNLMLSIQLHLQIDSTDQALAVDRVTELVGLREYARTVVSDLDLEHKLRMTIAQELLIDPTVLFVESPTLGLSYAASLSVMKLLRHIAASQGKTIVVSLHQPRWAVYNTVDNIALVHGGRLAYFGKAGEEAIEFFQTRGMIWNRQYTPTDFLLQLCSSAAPHLQSTIPTVCRLVANDESGGIAGGDEETQDEDTEAPQQEPPVDPRTDAQVLSENFQMSVEYQSYILPHIVAVVQESARILRGADTPQPPLRQSHEMVHSSNPRTKGLLRGQGVPRTSGGKRAKIQDPNAGSSSYILPGNRSFNGSAAPLPRMVKTRGSWDKAGLDATHSTTPVSSSSHLHQGYGTTQTGSAEVAPTSGEGEHKYVAEYAPFKEPSEFKRLFILLRCNAMRGLAYWKWYLFNIVLISAASFAIGNLYNISTYNQRALQNRVGVTFFAVMMQMLLNVPAASAFVRHRAVFLHQRASGSYGTVTYWAGTIIWELLVKRVFITLLCAVVVDQFISYKGGFGRLLGVLLVTQTAFYVLALAVGSVVPSVGVSSTLLYALFAFFTVTGGLLINSRSIPPFMQWIQLLSYFRYSYESLLAILFHDQEFNCPPKLGNEIIVNNQNQGCYDGNAYLQLQGFNIHRVWHNMYVLVVSSVTLLFVSLVALWLTKPPLVMQRPPRTWSQVLIHWWDHLYLTVSDLPRKMRSCRERSPPSFKPS